MMTSKLMVKIMVKLCTMAFPLLPLLRQINQGNPPENGFELSREGANIKMGLNAEIILYYLIIFSFKPCGEEIVLCSF